MFEIRFKCGGVGGECEVLKHCRDIGSSDETVGVGVDHVECFLEALDLLWGEGGV